MCSGAAAAVALIRGDVRHVRHAERQPYTPSHLSVGITLHLKAGTAPSHSQGRPEGAAGAQGCGGGTQPPGAAQGPKAARVFLHPRCALGRRLQHAGGGGAHFQGRQCSEGDSAHGQPTLVPAAAAAPCDPPAAPCRRCHSQFSARARPWWRHDALEVPSAASGRAPEQHSPPQQHRAWQRHPCSRGSAAQSQWAPQPPLGAAGCMQPPGRAREV